MADNPTCPACGHYNAILGRDCRDCGIDIVHFECAKLPQEFGLRGFPGETFRASRTASYVGDQGKVVIYLSIRVEYLDQGTRIKWVDHSKGSLEEIKREMVRL